MKYLRPLLTIIAFVLLPCFAQDSDAETYRVMRYAEFLPPYYFAESHFQKGIVLDLFSAIARETGDTFEFVHVPYKRALYKFDSGAIDIEPMANPKWRKNAAVLGCYSVPFAVSEQVVVFNAQHSLSSGFPEDLLGKTLGTVMGYTYPMFGPYFEDGRIRKYELRNETKLIEMLLADRIHQAVMNKDFALYMAKIHGAKGKLVISEPCNRVEMMIRVHPSKKHALPRFNKAIKKLLADGTIDKIYAQYR
ncbi:substrate-binding periplasmic protein [Maridesulfovibrio sp.]|uniref:substrate-binding periplasmic protein n=1 Tax=Maridesulfovibrio sp. TaxID=2795000 RepID=UPI0039EF287D